MKAFLFDLDGTLLLSQEEIFYSKYFELLGRYMSDLIEPKILVKLVNTTIEEITFDDGKDNNYERFMIKIGKHFKISTDEIEQRFKSFYNVPFKELKNLTRPNVDLISEMRKMDGVKVLATNPIFPEIAIRERMKWAELDDDDFTLVTFMENSYHLKPDPEYFWDISKKIGVKPQDCVMFGNDPFLDGACEKIGIKFILVGKTNE